LIEIKVQVCRNCGEVLYISYLNLFSMYVICLTLYSFAQEVTILSFMLYAVCEA